MYVTKWFTITKFKSDHRRIVSIEWERIGVEGKIRIRPTKRKNKKEKTESERVCVFVKEREKEPINVVKHVVSFGCSLLVCFEIVWTNGCAIFVLWFVNCGWMREKGEQEKEVEYMWDRSFLYVWVWVFVWTITTTKREKLKRTPLWNSCACLYALYIHVWPVNSNEFTIDHHNLCVLNAMQWMHFYWQKNGDCILLLFNVQHHIHINQFSISWWISAWK